MSDKFLKIILPFIQNKNIFLKIKINIHTGTRLIIRYIFGFETTQNFQILSVLNYTNLKLILKLLHPLNLMALTQKSI